MQQSVTLMNRTNATHAMTHAHAGAAFHFACAMTRSIQKSAKAIGGHPLLIDASVNAAKQFKYEAATEETKEIVEFKFNGAN